MDSVMDEEKNLKDSQTLTDVALKDTSFIITFSKTNKLITALYMVTDMMEKAEPLRLRLRTLGTEIISDMHSAPSRTESKISEVLSHLDIGSAVGMISEMNANILRTEFLGLTKAVLESAESPLDIAELFSPKELGAPSGVQRVGVQRAGTLLRALDSMSDKRERNKQKIESPVLKNTRKEKIKGILKNGGLSIKDISMALRDPLNGQNKTSEKTLQRELVAMIKDNVLYRVGSKRWSKYFLKS
ncbi:MAG: hypothetical protein AAB500_00090 [Patescibacteria group bacterium]